MLLQVVSNLANDYGDAESGADNASRVGPIRVMQAGLVTKAGMQRALIMAISIAVILGLILIYFAFKDSLSLILIFVGIGLSSIVAAITYTMGKLPYGYSGYGDISVLVFFGLVGVIGSYTLFSLQFYPLLILPASICGLLSASVLNINNIRDLSTDIEAGKYTLAARLGYRNAIYYHWCLILTAEILTITYILQADLPLATWLHLLVFPVFIFITRELKNYKNAPLMNKQLKYTVLTTFAYCSLLAIGLLI